MRRLRASDALEMAALRRRAAVGCPVHVRALFPVHVRVTRHTTVQFGNAALVCFVYEVIIACLALAGQLRLFGAGSPLVAII